VEVDAAASRCIKWCRSGSLDEFWRASISGALVEAIGFQDLGNGAVLVHFLDIRVESSTKIRRALGIRQTGLCCFAGCADALIRLRDLDLDVLPCAILGRVSACRVAVDADIDTP